MGSDLDKLARGLTEAQRRVLRDSYDLLFCREGRGMWPVRNALAGKGLADGRYRLTPLGLALKAHIERNEG
jgi:hypothetical protein